MVSKAWSCVFWCDLFGPAGEFMPEFFDADKVKIQIRVRKIFRQPMALIVTQIPKSLDGNMEKYLTIFYEYFNKLSVEERTNLTLLPNFFPCALAALDDDLSDERVRFVAEFVIQEAKILLLNYTAKS